MSLLSTKSTSPQIQEAILKEPIRIIKNWKDLKLGHSLKDFYCPTLTRLLKLTSLKDRSVEDQNILQPALAKDPPTMSLTQKGDEEFTCKLIARGNFLENIQLHATENEFKGIPFDGESSTHFVNGLLNMRGEDSEMLFLKTGCNRETYQKLQEYQTGQMPLALKIVTTFGFIMAIVKDITGGKTASFDNTQETVANLLQKSLTTT